MPLFHMRIMTMYTVSILSYVFIISFILAGIFCVCFSKLSHIYGRSELIVSGEIGRGIVMDLVDLL